MISPEIAIQTGDVLPSYPYLWGWQRNRGEDAGRKERPVCVAIVSRDQAGLTHLALLAISGTPPMAGQRAIKVPSLEIRRMGLQEHKQAWITVSEYNYDILELSFSVEPLRSPLKKLSVPFLKVILTALRPSLATSSSRIDRL